MQRILIDAPGYESSTDEEEAKKEEKAVPLTAEAANEILKNLQV
ncbi:hypothetical protein [Spirosoma sp. KCTC 42546]|nr:hypothetical protein [Spirosoma sp. KCTC 42546]